MTALAMIIGMIPMALGLGEGAEQNAPLGRAVIGGLLFATVSTLLFVPVRVRRRAPAAGAARRRRARRRRPIPPHRARRAEAMTEQRHSQLGADPASRTIRASCSSAARSCAAPGSPRSSCWCCWRSARRAPWSAACPTPTGARSRHGRARQAVRERRHAEARGGAAQTLSLPGTLQGFVQAPIAARASGYLKRWNKDIGSRVTKGELLAEIETPEIDQQLSAGDRRAPAGGGEPGARAAARVERWEALRKKDAVSQQELEERRSAVRAGARQPGRRRRQRASGCASSRASSAWWRRSPA